MPYIKRTDKEIIAAYTHWAKLQLKPESPLIMPDDTLNLTPKEIVEELKRGNPKVIKTFVKTLKNLAKKLDMDPLKIIFINTPIEPSIIN